MTQLASTEIHSFIHSGYLYGASSRDPRRGAQIYDQGKMNQGNHKEKNGTKKWYDDKPISLYGSECSTLTRQDERETLQ